MGEVLGLIGRWDTVFEEDAGDADGVQPGSDSVLQVPGEEGVAAAGQIRTRAPVSFAS